MNNLLINDRPLIVYRKLAKEVGVTEAIILQQIHFWTQEKGKVKDGRRWTYSTHKEWADQLEFCSEKTVYRATKKLEELGLLISANYNKHKFDKTKWYSINYENLKNLDSGLNKVEKPLNDAFGQNDHTHLDKMARPSSQNDHTHLDKMTRTIPKNILRNNTNTLSSSNEEGKEEENTQQERINYTLIKKTFNETCINMPKIRGLSEKRKQTIKARIKKTSLEDMLEMFKKASESDWLNGKNPYNWVADFDWLLKENNYLSILEGKHDNRGKKNKNDDLLF